MANMIQKAKQQVTELVTAAYLAAAEKGAYAHAAA